MSTNNNRSNNLNFGLNSRKKRKKGLTSFGGDESDSDDDEGAPSGPAATTARGAINRAISAEQAALRKRAEAAMAASSAMDATVYDYDAEYDSFSSGKKKEEEAARAAAAAKARADQPKAKVKPRYITSLLQTAERRNQEQEIIYNRKVMKEQEEEDKQLEYEGKEKFITSSYKRKLAEREQWAKEEKERVKREEAEDVTKKKGLGSFMFGGIGRSLLMGSGGSNEREKASSGGAEGKHKKEREDTGQEKVDDRVSGNGSHRENYQHRDSSRKTERWGSSQRNRDSRNEFPRHPPSKSDSGNDAKKGTSDNQNKTKTRQQILEDRAIKIRAARERYFKRKGGSVTQ